MEYKKILTVADLRDVNDSYEKGEISYSKMVELLNERISERLIIDVVSVPMGTVCDHPKDMRHGTGYLECQYCIKCGKQII